MSTFYSFRRPISREELENVGVKFHDGLLDDSSPYTWIVEEEDIDPNHLGVCTNYLHPSFHDGFIYGFTRYAGNNPEYLLDILDDNNIDFCSEYDLDDCYPVDDIISLLGIDVDSDEDLYDDITDLIMSDFYALDYYWAVNDGKGDEYINDWVTANKEYILTEVSHLIHAVTSVRIDTSCQ